MAGLDHAVAAAKHAGDPRTADQILIDHAIHLLTDGAHGFHAYPGDPDIAYDDPEDDEDDDHPRPTSPRIAVTARRGHGTELAGSGDVGRAGAGTGAAACRCA